MKAKRERQANFKKAYENLNKEEKEELNKIEKELKNTQDKAQETRTLISNRELKKKIAKVCLNLINKTPNDKTSITETSYLITGYFFLYKFGDLLDEVLEITSELELPKHHISGNIMQMWGKLKGMLEKYLLN